MAHPSKFDQGRSKAPLAETLPPFSLFPRRARGSVWQNIARGAVLLSVAGCATVERPVTEVAAQWREAEPRSGAGAAETVAPTSRPTFRALGGQDGQGRETVFGERGPDALPFPPFRLVFVGETADRIMRRLGEWAGIEYVSQDVPLNQAMMTVDMEIATMADVYALVEWIAQATGQSVRWRGETAVFAIREGNNRSPADGYLIRSAPVSPELAQIAADRFGVSCVPQGTLTVCVGSVLDIEDARRFFAALEGAMGNVDWRVIEAPVDVAGIVAALGLAEQVVASPVAEGRWLVAATDARLLDLVLSAVRTAGGPDCQPQSYRPAHVTTEAIGELLASDLVTLCGEPLVTETAVFFSATSFEAERAAALLVQVDSPADVARLMVVVAQETHARRLGLLNDNAVRFPDFSFGSGVQLTASLANAVGWRTLELTTDGAGTAAITATDRIQGDLVVTDGGTQIIGRENRTVGLTIAVDGDITKSGFRGRVSLRDSVLDGDTERGSNCEGYLTVAFDQIARVCSYRRADSARSLGLSELGDNKSAENFVVIAALLEHEVAALDTLRIVLSRVPAMTVEGGEIIVHDRGNNSAAEISEGDKI